jgi:hypothetical protein
VVAMGGWAGVERVSEDQWVLSIEISSFPVETEFHETQVDEISWNFMKYFMNLFMKFHEHLTHVFS